MVSIEKETQKTILQYLELKKIFHYRQNSGGFKTDNGHFYRMGITGAPDIIAVYKGVYIGIEVKDIKGKQSEGQKDFQERLENAGGIYILAKSLDDVINKLKTFAL